MAYAFDPNDELSITLTAAEMNVVLDALGNGAYRVVAPIIVKVNEQVKAQQKDVALTPAAPHLVS